LGEAQNPLHTTPHSLGVTSFQLPNLGTTIGTKINPTELIN